VQSAQHNPPGRRTLTGWRLWLASAFLLWHCAAMVVAPAPGSYALSKIFPAFWPYLSALHLYNEWSFFAPHPDRGRMLLYTIETADGQSRTYPLTAALQRSDPAFSRYTTLYTEIARQDSPFYEAAADYLCRRHRDIAPVRLTFLVRHQLLLTPDDYKAGKRPLDDEFLEDERLEPVPCK
jgi:hypothetical protein